MRRSGAVRCSRLVTESSALQQGLRALHQPQPWTDRSFTGTTERSRENSQRQGGAATKAVHGTCVHCVPSGVSLATPPPQDRFSHVRETPSYTKTRRRGGAIYTTSRQTRQHGGEKSTNRRRRKRDVVCLEQSWGLSKGSGAPVTVSSKEARWGGGQGSDGVRRGLD